VSKYWVYLDDKVSGPYTVDQMIRLRGFSKQTRICEEDGSGNPQKWISPADLPELSHIFKAVHDVMTAPTPPRPAPKPPSKPKPRRTSDYFKEPEVSVTPKKGFSWTPVVLSVVLLGGGAGGYQFWKFQQKSQIQKDAQSAQRLVEDWRLPSNSAYPTFGQYLIQKDIAARWEVEHQPTGLFQVTASWFENTDKASPTSTVYAFESNLQAKTVRPLNSKAAKLMAEGIGGASKPAAAAPAAPAKPKVPEFSGALDDWSRAQQSGDFDTVWNSFSSRKVNEMRKGGISRDGFMRVQSLTKKSETGTQIKTEKIKNEGDNGRLVLLRQTQPGRADLFIKQYWTLEDNVWKLDDEEKKTAEATPTSAAPTDAPARPPVTSLPGISN